MLQTTRRTVLSAAAWTVPVVTVSTAAPAFAGSDPEPIAFAGSTAVVTDGEFFGVQFTDAILTIAPNALSAGGQLTMTVTFQPTIGSDELYSDMTAPQGWTHAPRSVAVRNQLVFTYSSWIPASGTVVPISDGIYFGTDDITQRGTFVLTFRAGPLTAMWSGSTS